MASELEQLRQEAEQLKNQIRVSNHLPRIDCMVYIQVIPRSSLT